MAKRAMICECTNPGCPVHKGASSCGKRHVPGDTLYRIDMDDTTGVRFCPGCLEDALDSGVFGTEAAR